MEKNLRELAESILSGVIESTNFDECAIRYIMSGAGYSEIKRALQKSVWGNTDLDTLEEAATNICRQIFVVWDSTGNLITDEAMFEVILNEYEKLKQVEAEHAVREAMELAIKFGLALNIHCEGEKELYLPPDSKYTKVYKESLKK